MDWVDDYIGNADFEWLPYLVFGSILTIGLLTGFLKGWRTSVYFLVGDLIGIVIGIFALGPIVEWAVDQPDVDNVDLVKFNDETRVVVPLIMIGWILIFRFITWVFYAAFFRKHLRANMGKAQVAKMAEKTTGSGAKYVQNGRTRLIGGAVSLVGAVPLAFFAVNAVTIMSGDNGMSGMTNSMMDVMTFGEYNGSSEYVSDINSLIKLLDNDGIDVIKDIFSGGNTSSPEFQASLDENHEQIQDLLNGKSVDAIIKSVDSENFNPVDMQDALDNGPLDPLADDQKFEVTDQRFNEIKDLLISEHGWDTIGGTTPADQDAAWAEIQNAYFKTV